MSKPTPKQNFLQTAILMLTIFMGIQLFMKKPNPQQALPPTDLFVQMQKDNDAVLDQSIVPVYREYVSKIDSQMKDKTLTAEQGQAKKIEAAILLADTQFKGGLNRKDTNRLRAAYYTLAPFEKTLLDKPEWKDVRTNVPYDPAHGWRSWSGQELYDAVVEKIKAANKTDLIWGFIPGGYQFIDTLVSITGRVPSFSYAFAAFLLALVVRAIVYPLAQKQLMFSRQMTQLAPLVKELKEKYGKDPNQLNVKTMELYKEYGINPLAGCFPSFVQLPLFLGVYQCMLHYQFEFSNGTFLWINREMSKATHGFIAPNLGQLDYILIVIYGVSMVITTLLQPITDPSNIKQQRMIGLFFAVFVPITLLFGVFPVAGAFVLYWTFTNILATAQSLRAYRMPMVPLQKVNAPGGGTFPAQPKGKWAEMFEKMQRAAEEQSRNGSNPKLDTPKKDGAKKDGPAKKDEEGGTGRPATHKPKKRR